MNEVITKIKKKRESKAKKIRRSIQAAEVDDLRVHKKAIDIQQTQLTTTGLDEKTIKIVELASLYYTMKADYYKKPSISHSVNASKSSKALWERVYNKCTAAGVSPKHFIRAQFQYFHVAFGTVPQLVNLTTEAAVDRARLYKDSNSRIVGSSTLIDTSLSAVFSRCEQQVRDICRAQRVTREEYYRKFVVTNLLPMPPEFLEADPVYMKVIKECH